MTSVYDSPTIFSTSLLAGISVSYEGYSSKGRVMFLATVGDAILTSFGISTVVFYGVTTSISGYV